MILPCICHFNTPDNLIFAEDTNIQHVQMIHPRNEGKKLWISPSRPFMPFSPPILGNPVPSLIWLLQVQAIICCLAK